MDALEQGGGVSRGVRRGVGLDPPLLQRFSTHGATKFWPCNSRIEPCPGTNMHEHNQDKGSFRRMNFAYTAPFNARTMCGKMRHQWAVPRFAATVRALWCGMGALLCREPAFYAALTAADFASSQGTGRSDPFTNRTTLHGVACSMKDTPWAEQTRHKGEESERNQRLRTIWPPFGAMTRGAGPPSFGDSGRLTLRSFPRFLTRCTLKAPTKLSLKSDKGRGKDRRHQIPVT